MKLVIFNAAIHGIKNVKKAKPIYSEEYIKEMDRADKKILEYHLNLRKTAKKSKNFIANKGGML